MEADWSKPNVPTHRKLPPCCRKAGKEVAVVNKNPTENLENSKDVTRKKPRFDKRWVWLGVLVAFALVSFGLWEYTSSASFCASCHSIAPSVEGWRDSAHADAASCLDCHSDKGFIGEFVAHVGGVQEVYVQVTESPEASDIRGFVPSARCMNCHEDDWDELPSDHPTAAAPCGVCHRDSAHTNEKPLYELSKEGE